MGFSDSDFISKEKHELDYVLRKWDKRSTQENRDKLASALDRFKADASQKPHTRALFYTYAESTGLIPTLASKEGNQPASFIPANSRPLDAVQTGPRLGFRWWWVLALLVILLILFFLLRGCISSGNAARATALPVAPVAAPESIPVPAQAAASAASVLSLESIAPDLLVLRFTPDSTTVLADGEDRKISALVAAIKALKSSEGRLVIVGHAASVGFPAGEQAVSEGRALYIARRLAEAGLPQGISVITEGRGSSEKLPGDNAELAAAASRRVRISAK